MGTPYATTALYNSFTSGAASNPIGPLFEIRAAPTCLPIIHALWFRSVLGNNGVPWALGIARGLTAGSTVQEGGESFPMVQEGAIGIPNSLLLGPLTIYTRWTKPPAAPASFLRRVAIQGGFNTANNQRLPVRFARGFRLASGDSLLVWSIGGPNSAATASMEMTAEVDT